MGEPFFSRDSLQESAKDWIPDSVLMAVEDTAANPKGCAFAMRDGGAVRVEYADLPVPVADILRRLFEEGRK